MSIHAVEKKTDKVFFDAKTHWHIPHSFKFAVQRLQVFSFQVCLATEELNFEFQSS
jgi:hypothetical protein